MKEIRYIFDGVAILAFIASAVAFFISLYCDTIHDRANSIVALEMYYIMVLIGFIFWGVGISAKD